jgi:hypothetical protein
MRIVNKGIYLFFWKIRTNDSAFNWSTLISFIYCMLWKLSSIVVLYFLSTVIYYYEQKETSVLSIKLDSLSDQSCKNTKYIRSSNYLPLWHNWLGDIDNISNTDKTTITITFISLYYHIARSYDSKCVVIELLISKH